MLNNTGFPGAQKNNTNTHKTRSMERPVTQLIKKRVFATTTRCENANNISQITNESSLTKLLAGAFDFVPDYMV
jgi:hypothetical protein